MESVRFFRRHGAAACDRATYARLRKQGLSPASALANALSVSPVHERGEQRRTVYTWGIGYRIADKSLKTLSGGLNIRYITRNCDGGPYLSKESAVAAALKARGELMDLHGCANVGRYEIQSHQAPVSQPAFA